MKGEKKVSERLASIMATRDETVAVDVEEEEQVSSSLSSSGSEKRGEMLTTMTNSEMEPGGAETLLVAKRRKPRPPLKRRLWRTIRKNRWFILFMSAFALFLILGGILLWKDVFSWAAWWSLVVLWITFGLLIKNFWDPAISMMVSMTLLVAPGIITAKEAASGFGDTLIISLAALYIVASAIEYTGCLIYLNHYVLGYVVQFFYHCLSNVTKSFSHAKEIRRMRE